MLSIFSANAQNWQSLDGGFNQSVFTLYADTVRDRVYASGWFNTTGGNPADYVAQWDGTSWQQFGNSLQSLFAFCYHKDTLLATGVINDGYYQQIGWWNGSNWVVTDSADYEGTINGLFSIGDSLIAHGRFDTIQHVAAKGIAFRYNGQWQSLNFPYISYSPPPFPIDPPSVNNVAYYNGELYAGGTFEDTTGYPINLARYDGTSWHPVPGLSGGWGAISTMAVYNGELYVGGGFTSPYKGIAKWNGSTWSSVGGGVTNPGLGDVFNLKVHNGKLYAAGQFSEIGGVNAPYLAQWDGIQWCNFVGSDIISTTSRIVFWKDTMYVTCADIITMQDTVGGISKWLGDYIGDTCGAVGINEAAIETGINLYPNPFFNNITLAFEAKGSEEVLISLYNTLGQAVYVQNTHCDTGLNQTTIDFSSLRSGVYVLQVKQGDRVHSQTIIRSSE
jgi:hypothetical protein